MPITYRVHPVHRLVVARAEGHLTIDDFTGYMREAWTKPDVVGFNELVDVTGQESLADPTGDQLQALARMSAQLEPPVPGVKTAVVASDDLLYGLGRMYEAFRATAQGSTRTVGVFRTRTEALAFLGLDPQVDSEL